MATLREKATTFVGKKELFDLDKIPLDIEIKEDTFDGKGENAGKKIPYSYIEIGGWKYTIRANIMEQMQTIALTRPTTKFVKVNKTPKGELFVVPLD